MSELGLAPALGSLAAAVTLAAGILAFLSVLLRRRRPAAHPGAAGPAVHDAGSAVFLFEDGVLADATPAARHILAALRGDDPSLAAVANRLARRFPDLSDRLRRIGQSTDSAIREMLAGSDGTESLLVESARSCLRLTILPADSAAERPALNSDSGRIAALEEELQTLRALAEDAPQLIWQQDSDGKICWANRAYLALADRLSPRGDGDDPIWPARPFLVTDRPPQNDGETRIARARLEIPGLAEPLTYEVTSVRRGTRTVHFAVDASNIVAAEHGRQTFIQTLTRTFAHLSAGLAIFDRDRRLVLFNPAFLDLTSLPATFLSQRPQVGAVLDRLRDLQMLPEPKNYSSWRDRVAALEAAAVRGTYSETWSLPSGRTYRVSGRPHPDGAIAFLFEDVSDEILLTRHFRSELETAQSVLDSLEEAVAVFSPAGTLTLTNTAYADLWGQQAIGLREAGIAGEIAHWQARTLPSPVWDRLADSLQDLRSRTNWQDTLRINDGRSLTCRFLPLPGGSSLVAFRPQSAETPHLGRAGQERRPRAVAAT